MSPMLAHAGASSMHDRLGFIPPLPPSPRPQTLPVRVIIRNLSVGSDTYIRLKQAPLVYANPSSLPGMIEDNTAKTFLQLDLEKNRLIYTHTQEYTETNSCVYT